MKNICETCGRNYAEFPLVLCIREPYEDYHVTLTCRHYVTETVARMEKRLAKIEMEKRLLAKRRAIRKEARRLRWAEYKQPDNQCRTCANNTSIFPLVQCKMQPYAEEEEYQDDCVNYHKITPGELIVFTKFPCGTVLESVWERGCCRRFGYGRVDGKRPIAGSLIGTPPLDLEIVEYAYKFLDYGMHPTDRKLFMNDAVKEALGIQI